ncbi:MAG: VCBS repeat-containing protein [Acidobacteriota bacterium]|nr:VCBS repeat-containing protein [Pyrinomonadaceae bacterium]MDW8303260.1 VCBS repeat-containing protein [Acidobacteriota bacterium]
MKKLKVHLLGLLVCSLAVQAQIIYDNGPLATGSVSKSGVAAPSGTQWSEVQNNSFETTVSNTTAGVGCQLIGTTTNNRCADDFIVPVGQTWTINAVVVFAYQTGYSGTTSPFVGANLRIWNGFPEASGSTVVFGDTTTNRLGASTNSGLYRIFNSAIPAPGTTPGTTRIIWQNTINVSPAVSLGPGHYWIDFQLDAGSSGNFVPTTTIVGIRATPIMNAIQKVGTAAWAQLIDTGNPATAPDVPMDFPFKLIGSISGSTAPRRSRVLDFDGDNRTDYAVVRSTSATSQSTWYIANSGGTFSTVNWGLGVGFSSGDRAVPRDYDGDGKTDIAVWRPGPPTVAAFYILRSSSNTLQVEQFGQTGDDPSVVDDYDGDGKADVAVYRDGGSGQSFFYYRGTFNNPSGGTTYIPWGIGGDKAVPGDYDGDGRADPTVVRNSGGNAVFYSRLSGGSVRVTFFGLFTDKFAPGDYDGDNRTDICVVRTNAGGQFEWYVLRSSDNQTFGTSSVNYFGFGVAATDYIVQGDYDGDNRTDFGIWRSATGAENGYFYIVPSLSAILATKWGNSSSPLISPDYPAANYNVR